MMIVMMMHFDQIDSYIINTCPLIGHPYHNHCNDWVSLYLETFTFLFLTLIF